MFVKVCSCHSWADTKLLIEYIVMIYYLDIQGHPSLVLVRKGLDLWCLKPEKKPQFALEGQTEWSCWHLSKASRFRVGSPSLPPSPGDAGISQGQFMAIQSSESTWGDSSFPVWFTNANIPQKPQKAKTWWGEGAFVCDSSTDHCKRSGRTGFVTYILVEIQHGIVEQREHIALESVYNKHIGRETFSISLQGGP